MREILFRGKGQFSDKWRYGGITVSKTGLVFISHDRIDRFIQKDTVGQYTGIKDSNGSKIFEGDILKCTNDDYETHIGKVVYDEVMFELEPRDVGCDCNTISFYHNAGKIKVIGNIFDNPELVEELK